MPNEPSFHGFEGKNISIPDYESYDYLNEWKNREIENKAERDLLRGLVKGRFSKESATCLELGGGFGRLTGVLLPYFESVCLVDYSVRNLSLAARHRDASLVRSDIRLLPFADCTFECIVAVRVLHHIENIHSILGEMVRVGKVGGLVILGVPNLRFGRYKGIRGNETVRISPSQHMVYVHPNSDYKHESLDLVTRKGLGLFDNRIGRMLHRVWSLSEVDRLTSYLWWAKPENFLCFKIAKVCENSKRSGCRCGNSGASRRATVQPHQTSMSEHQPFNHDNLEPALTNFWRVEALG